MVPAASKSCFCFTQNSRSKGKKSELGLRLLSHVLVVGPVADRFGLVPLAVLFFVFAKRLEDLAELGVQKLDVVGGTRRSFLLAPVVLLGDLLLPFLLVACLEKRHPLSVPLEPLEVVVPPVDFGDGAEPDAAPLGKELRLELGEGEGEG